MKLSQEEENEILKLQLAKQEKPQTIIPPATTITKEQLKENYITKTAAAVELLKILYKLRMVCIVSLVGSIVGMLLNVANMLLGGAAVLVLAAFIGFMLTGTTKDILFFEKKYTGKQKVTGF